MGVPPVPEDQLAEILILGEDDGSLDLGLGKQLRIRSLCVGLRRVEDLVALGAKPGHQVARDVLVGQDMHGNGYWKIT
jgi:hypothetical protein